MANVTLTAAVRDSLLSLQSTTKLIEQTQGRLSSGLRVASPVDDPVAYFQAKSLNDRSFDFNEKKDSIDQGISTVTAALDGVSSIETLVRQLKGTANSMKSATATQLEDLVTQFNDLRNQINYLASDASYQGTNLINGTGTTLEIEFSDQSQSVLNIDSVDLTVATGGLNVDEISYQSAGSVIVSYAAKASSTGYLVDTSASFGFSGGILTAGDTISLTWAGAESTVTAGDTLTLTYGTGSTLSITVTSGVTFNNGDIFTVNVLTAGATNADYYVNTNNAITTNFAYSLASGAGVFGTAVTAGETIALTWGGSNALTFSTGNNNLTANIGIASGYLLLGSSTVFTVSAGGTFNVTVVTAAANATGGTGLYYVVTGGAATASFGTGAIAQTVAATNVQTLSLATTGGLSANTVSATYVGVGTTTEINALIGDLDTALATLRSQASTLGANVATLQTRLDFTSTYVNTLESGAGKLTLADINTEGANLLALQTRQQLGINSLSFAGQAEQSILSLFR
jgi:flagellin-like hook-associated protein FlgL